MTNAPSAPSLPGVLGWPDELVQGVRRAVSRVWWVLTWLTRWAVGAAWWWAPLTLVWVTLAFTPVLSIPLVASGFLDSPVPVVWWRPWVLIAAFTPCLVSLVWDWANPISYARWCATPIRQARMGTRLRAQWRELATNAGWVTTVARTRGVRVVMDKNPGTITLAPKLGRVRLRGPTLRLLVRVRPGQTLDELATGVPKVAAMLDAKSVRCFPAGASLSVLVVELVMADTLKVPRLGVVPTGVASPAGSHVLAGRSQGGTDWALRLAGSHWLIVGCSGSGKGSVMWSMLAGLTPGLLSGTVRLWGIDLKGGVELAMGKRLFHTTAYDMKAAIKVLVELKAVVEARQVVMRGVSRDHVAAPGDPLHVLFIDEIAVLLAYAPKDLVKEAEQLLAFILTQGRAMGVIVIACGQDPRKETMSLRGLFTMVVALRLRSASETAMVLGDGLATVAPAHKIPPLAKGTVWVIEEDGTADRVRADYWSDDAIRALAARYGSTWPRRATNPTPPPDATETVIEGEPVVPAAAPTGSLATGDEPATGREPAASDQSPVTGQAPAPAAGRSPRKPRAPRAPRAPRGAGGVAGEGGEAA